MAKNARTYRGIHFGAVLRDTCAQLDVTQTELARRMGCRQHWVSEVFASESITEATLDRFVAALGVELVVRIVA